MLAQTDSAVIYFDGSFRQETEMQYVRYYGVPQQIDKKRYLVKFYTLEGVPLGTGEYSSANYKRRDGVFVRYWPDQSIQLTANYKNGVLHGTYQAYHLNGVLSDSGNFDHNIQQGTWKSWHTNGRPKQVMTFKIARGARGSESSALENEYRSWFDNGHLKDSGMYTSNRRTGIWIEWLAEGQVRSMGEYKRGWKRGIWKYYDPNGKLLYMRRFSKWKYDEQGEMVPFNK